MKKKLILYTIVIAGIVVLLKTLPINIWISNAIQYYASLGWMGALLYIVSYSILALLLIPGSLLTLGAAPIYGFWWGYIIVTLGAMGSVAIAFWLANGLFRDKVEAQIKKYPKFEAVQNAIEDKGLFIVLLVRISPVFPFSISNYLFGLTRVNYGPYLLVTWIGMIPGTFLYVYIGLLGKELAESSGQLMGLKYAFLAAGLIATFISVWWISKLAKKSLEKSLKETGN